MATATPTEAFRQLAEIDPEAAAQVLKAVGKAAFVPHDGGQKEVMASKARFRVIRAGRRWGKTEVAAHEILHSAISNPGSMNWWVGNVDNNVRRGYRKVLKYLPKDLLARPAPSDKANSRILEFKNGSRIEFYTAGTPDAMAGEGVDFVVVDEAALIPENVWFQIIRPTLADSGGRAILISTPRGRNWFWRLWNRGQKGGDWDSFHYRTADNPTIPDEEVEDFRQELPHILFEQEVMAEFIEDAATIFRLGREGSVKPALVEPAGNVVLGIDLAKHSDFTVISGANAEDRLPCVYERFNEISWPQQEAIIKNVIEDLEANELVESVSVLVDSGGPGDVVFDHLDDAGIDVVPINFTTFKEKMVRLLAADIEHGRSYITEDMRDEFEAYEYEITNNGRYKFEAAVGHDDKVSAKMLENWGITHEVIQEVNVMDLNTPPAEGETSDDQEPDELIERDTVADIMARPDAWS